jgi:hypothetical protein
MPTGTKAKVVTRNIQVGGGTRTKDSYRRQRAEEKRKARRREREGDIGCFKWFVRIIRTPVGMIICLFAFLITAVAVLRGGEESRQVLMNRLKNF